MPKDASTQVDQKLADDRTLKFNVPALTGKEFDYLQTVLANGHLAGGDQFTVACEARLRELTGSLEALLVHSCTGALEMAAILCDLAPGDEVIMPSFTFVSTANAVVLRGAVPVFVDVDPRALNLDASAVAAAVTKRTKAIFAVHYAGVPADMVSLAEIARSHGLILVEDAAQALGSSYYGRPCGSLADLATFSFHETKNITSGEGGALTVNRPDLVERADIIRDKGTNRARFLEGAVDKYTWVDIGSSYTPSELVAAMLFAQLEQVERVSADRLATCDRYRAGFADLERTGRIELPFIPEHCRGNGHLFFLLLRDAQDQKAFIAHMREHGIETPFHYVPLHSAPAGRLHGRASGSLAVTDSASSRLVRLPLYFGMNAEVDRVIDVARQYLTKGATARLCAQTIHCLPENLG